jgi:spermidine synthase
MIKRAKIQSFLLGYTDLSLQIILMREIFIVFYGNELGFGLFLGVWMCWFAFGAWLGNFQKVRKTLSVHILSLQVFVFMTVFFSLLLLKYVRIIFNIPYGGLFSIYQLLVTNVFILFIPCSLLGIQFSSLATRMKKTNNPSAQVYVYESIGGVFASLVATFILVRYFANLQALVASFCIVMFVELALQKKRMIKIGVMCALIVLIFPFLSNINFYLAKQYWRSVDDNFELLALKNTKYGQTTIIQSNGKSVIYSNGLKQTALPDLMMAQSSSALIFTQHPSPENILYIGNGLSGIVAELTNYPGIKVDHIALDETAYNFAVSYYPDSLKGEDKVRHIFEDGRRYLAAGLKKEYDIIAVNVGTPSSSLSNRFYTKEFFKSAKNGLKENGVLAVLNFPSAENYMGPELLNLNKTMLNTLSSVFNHLLFVPGDNAHYFASNQPILAMDSKRAQQRYNKTNLSSLYFHPSMFDYLLAPFRIEQAKQQLQDSPNTSVNLDEKPVCYFYDFLYWHKVLRGENSIARLFGKINKRWVLMILSGISLLWIVIIFFSAGKRKPFVLFGLTLITGYISISLNITLLLIFQTTFGYIYEWIGLALAAFMLGLGLGAQFVYRFVFQKIEKIMNINLMVLGITLFVFIPLMKLIQQDHSLLLFYFLSFWCGAITGSAFPMLNGMHVMNKSLNKGGTIYAWDLLGGAVGSMLITGLLVPLFGFEFPIHICILLLLTGFMLFNLVLVRKSSHVKFIG